ncbi:MAG TPA: PQQ-binding-like beta-propeller repeat protein [Gemmataceae bacterium]|nr:PQQ-binding-like beta-propeller repeat protein [Gemmataceae bacterium]
MRLRIVSWLTLSVAALLATVAPALAADWPQWRGPDRSNASEETGLLGQWPEEGPPIVWTADDLGQGVPSVAVAGGKVYVLGYRDGNEYLTALAEMDGKPVWSTPIGPAVNEQPAMRWLSQRTPTVDGDRVYAFTARGELICLGTADGKVRWRKDYVKDFAGRPGSWGYCDFPLVDGDRLICTPGVKDSAIVALDKKTGELVWRCAVPTSTRGTYGGIVLAEITEVRQYVHQLEGGVVGVSAKEGKLLWHYPGVASPSGNVHTVIVQGDEVFASCGWNVGAALLRVKREGDTFAVTEVYRARDIRFDQWLGSSVRLGPQVHAANGLSIDWKTGGLVESSGKVVPTSRITMTAADGRLIHRNGNGLVTLTEVTPGGTYVRRGEFKIAPVAREPTWTFPVVANGRLYLRDQGTLTCHDLRGPEPGGKPPAVIFVPTPPDVVEKMLEVAKVTADDVVVDLGCGDGRIVVTAAKKYGCRAVGYDLDPECVRLSRAAVRKSGVGVLVRIDQRDVLELDLTGATVVTLYLGRTLNAKLVPQLEKLKSGSRVVSHAFAIPGMRPDRVVKVTSTDDDVERPVYLYTVPLTRE